MTAKRRKKIKAACCMLMLALCPLLLSGCWDRRELNDTAIVVASAIDLEPDGRFRFSIELPLPGQMGGGPGGGGGSGGGGKKGFYVESDVGDTVREAMTIMQARMSRLITLSHRRVLLISEEVAKKEGIYRIFDESSRMPENRLTGYMVITQGRASDLLDIQPPFERLSSETIRKLAKGGATLEINMKNVARSLAIPGSDPIVAYMGKKKTQGVKEGKESVQFLGFAQFREDRMVGNLDLEASNGLMWLRRRVRPYITGISVTGKDKTVIQVLEGQCLISPTVDQNHHVRFHFDVQARVGIHETREDLDFDQAQIVLAVAAKTEEKIKQEIGQAIAAMQKNKADSASLGQTVNHKYPMEWRYHLRDKWREELAAAEMTMRVNATIVQTGLISENIAKRVTQ